METRGMSIFVGILAAISSALCIRWVREISDCTLRASEMLVPKRSAWISVATKLSSSLKFVLKARFLNAVVRSALT